MTLALPLLVACGPPRPLTPEVSYDYFCARCHGEDGSGDPQAIDLNPKLDLRGSEMVIRADREAVRERILEGEGSMPGFRDKLEPHEVQELVDYTLEQFGGQGEGRRTEPIGAAAAAGAPPDAPNPP